MRQIDSTCAREFPKVNFSECQIDARAGLAGFGQRLGLAVRRFAVLSALINIGGNTISTKAYRSILGAIGNTPSIWLDRLTRKHGLKGRIMAKLDYLNPGYSKKDRAALGVIDEAEARDLLEPGQVVVELTSGNMGAGLAMVCALRGYPFVAVMSAGNSQERARMMRAFGAEVVLVPQAEGGVSGQVTGDDLALVEAEVLRICAARGAFRADQFELQGNPLAHELGTGPELWEASDGTLTAFADFVGSGGTYSGVIKALQQKAKVRGYIVEPEGAEALAGLPIVARSHPIQGGGYAKADLRFMKDAPVDGWLSVSGDAARETARELAQVEGIFGGFSGGANVAAAMHLLSDLEEGGRIAVIIPDSGLKYLSTDLWA
ncbi:MAG: cysteine synthase family protein [Rhodobacteraceae bacterium]|nr:cysteine synthase family protein [Paracoccaceae bacterium]